MNSFFLPRICYRTVSLLLLAGLPVMAAPTNAFFAFCMDTHDAKKRTLPEQARMLKELDYAGAGHLWLDNLAERLATLDTNGLRLFQITLAVNVAPGKPAYDARLKELMPLLRGRKVQLALLMSGLKPSDPAGDPRAIEILRELSALAEPAGVEIVLYPHTSDWIETLEDALRVAERVERPNVGVMFNLCHWLRVSKTRDYQALIRRALPRLKAVSINGADEQDPEPGWARYIQPLGRGSFDVRRLVRSLQEMGYAGPVGLQCYGIPGDARDHLAESMKAWKGFD